MHARLDRVGGGGANVAIGCRKHGLRTAVVGMIGNNVFRKSILERFQKSKVSTKYTLFNQTDTSVSIILLSPSGERSIIVHSSPRRHTTAEKHILRVVKQVRAVYMGHMPDGALQYRLLAMERLSKAGTFIVVNLGKRECVLPKPQIEAVLEHANMLILNADEFSLLVGKPVKKIDLTTSVFKHLPIMKNKLLVITDASRGSYTYHADRVYFQKALSPKKIVDTTGAGDAYTAGYIASYLKHEDIQRAMKTGSQYAAHTIGHIGAN
ncbi:carbohydrate kinase family protein [Candidatus Microgenomates bacterium]|nr:carbohydrate kinase family protein [Candidatus Microgenomates bacterium]